MRAEFSFARCATLRALMCLTFLVAFAARRASAEDVPPLAAPSPAPPPVPAAPAPPSASQRLLELRYDDWSAALEGEWRLRLTYLTALQPVDAALIPSAQQPDSDWLEDRLRLDPSITWRANLGPLAVARLVAEADLAKGVIGGDMPPERAIRDDQIDVAELRHLYGEAVLGTVLVRAGRQGSKWGLGIVANDGIGEAPFGDKRYGDRVDRVALRWAPQGDSLLHPLVLAAAVDRPVEDDLTRHGWQDHAWNYIVSALYAGRAPGQDGALLGVYDVFREQRNQRDTNTRIDLVDVYLSVHAGSWMLDGEGVLAAGNTELVATPASPKQADVLESGAALSGGWSSDELDLLLDGGYASGDGNPFDDRVRGFTFDPDFNVGLIMFEEYLAALTAASKFNLGDPALVGSAAPGAYLVETRGGVTNAVYLNPRVTWRAARDEGWEAKLGFLWAQALEDVVDPFESFVAGGTPRNFVGGAPGKHDLGYEIDGGLGYRIRDDMLRVFVGAEAGGYWPGAAFRDSTGVRPDAIALIQGRITANW